MKKIIVVLVLAVLLFSCDAPWKHFKYEVLGSGNCYIAYFDESNNYRVLPAEQLSFEYSFYDYNQIIWIQAISENEITVNIYKNNNIVLTETGYAIDLLYQF